VDAFEQWVHGGLAQIGLDADEADVQIMRYVNDLFGPELQALMAADLHNVMPEHGQDLSRAPQS